MLVKKEFRHCNVKLQLHSLAFLSPHIDTDTQKHLHGMAYTSNVFFFGGGDDNKDWKTLINQKDICALCLQENVADLY